MLMSPAARRSVVGNLGFDANANIEESKSPTRPKAGRRATNQSSTPKQSTQTIDEEAIDQTVPNKRRSRRLKDDPIIEEDDEQLTVQPTASQPVNQSNGDALASQAELEADGPPPQPSTNGWGGANNQSTNPSHNQSNNPQAPFGRRARGQATNAKEDDVIADLAEIPDVEAEIKEDITMQVAESTHLRSHIVPALTELDAQLQNPRLSVIPNSAINATINQTFDSREIDLSLLYSCLTAPSIVYDSQNVWDFDTLLSEVASEMYAEGEVSEEEKEESSEGPKQSPRRQTTKAA